jgi:hypothetical protein
MVIGKANVLIYIYITTNEDPTEMIIPLYNPKNR